MAIERIPSIMVGDFGGKEILGLCQEDHLLSLKALTEKLQVETRRSSYLGWRAQLEAQATRGQNGKVEYVAVTEDKYAPGSLMRQGPRAAGPGKGCGGECITFTGLRGFGSIDEALVWLRKELVSRNLCFVV